MTAQGSHDPTQTAIESQKRFYDQRAPDYLTGAESDRPGAETDSGIPVEDLRQLIEELRPSGSVLEFGCGPGGCTRELARYADHVTALDAAPQMLQRNQREVAAANVCYVEADVFEWEAPATYDLVFFGLLLSHVPPVLFDRFWKLVRRCVAPEGRVAFIDEDRRVAHYDDVRIEDGLPLARRRLADGREFDIVKQFWDSQELEVRLEQLGWDIDVRSVGTDYLVGVGTPQLA